MKQFSNIILYVLLLLHFPLFYFSNNLIDLSIFSFVELLGITFIVGFIIIMVFFIISKLIKKITNPIVILICIFLFFSYGIFYELLNDNEIEIRHIYLIPLFAMVFLITLKFSPNSTKKTTQILFTILIFLVVSDLLILFSELDYDETGVYWNFSDDLTNIDLGKFPSIIWIIPDEYPSVNSLQHMTSYDNSNFTNNLTNLGFEIKDIHSNYDDSIFSIGSTMNMDYLIKTDKQYSMNTEVSNSRLIKLLKSNNYELTHINGAGSYSIEKVDNHFCETNIILKHNEFFKTTMLDFILVLSRPLYTNLMTSHVDNVECFFRELNQLENMDMKQKFVIAHVMLPHRPYLDKNEFGSLQPLDSTLASAKGLLGNVKIVNNELMKVLPNIIKNNPNTIILIMSDHGFRYDPYLQPEKATEFQKFRHENFLAIYLPNDFKLGDINSSVNLFRSILENSSNNVPILEDRFFHSCYTELKEIYNFENYTVGSKMLKENCIKN
jgi:hypothetical protein